MRRRKTPVKCKKCGKPCYNLEYPYHEKCISNDWDPINYIEFNKALDRVIKETREKLNKSVRIIKEGVKEV